MLALAATSCCSASITSGRCSSTCEDSPTGTAASVSPAIAEVEAVGSSSAGTGPPASSVSAFRSWSR